MAALERPIGSLMEFIPYVTPSLQAPHHLAPIISSIEATRDRAVQQVISTPPQHGKSQSLMHGLPWLLKQSPKRHAYITYNDDKAQEVSRETQWIAARAGLKFSGNLNVWTIKGGGSIRFTGIGGTLTGAPIDGVLVVDDSVKNREEAESATIRRRTEGWFRSSALTRMHPGASAIIVQTRWHPDDLAGQLTREGWPTINLPAIDDQGKALWEAGRPLKWLEERRDLLGPYEWGSLFMGQPRLKGSRLFSDDVPTWTQLPSTYRVAIGVDLAYTAKTSADHSIAVVIAEFNNNWYVLDVIRRQVQAPDFVKELLTLQTRYATAGLRWYAAGTEKGSADFMRRNGLRLHAMSPIGDKFQRAQPVSAAWNAGKVFLPVQAPWLADFRRVVTGFTGVNDSEDDDVDALAAAFDQVPGRHVEDKPVLGSPEWQRQEDERMREHARLRVVKQQDQQRGAVGGDPFRMAR